jgi:hypothetical protein
MKQKQLGIWMDHTNAHLITLHNGETETKTIDVMSDSDKQDETLFKGERNLHHKKQQEELAYFKKIAAVILDFEKVLLFGPTHAKTELLNLLKADHHFDKIKIEIKQTDKLTENQQNAFVKAYFIA